LAIKAMTGTAKNLRGRQASRFRITINALKEKMRTVWWRDKEKQGDRNGCKTHRKIIVEGEERRR